MQFLQHNENNVETDITKKAGKENGCVQINIANALDIRGETLFRHMLHL